MDDLMPENKALRRSLRKMAMALVNRGQLKRENVEKYIQKKSREAQR